MLLLTQPANMELVLEAVNVAAGYCVHVAGDSCTVHVTASQCADFTLMCLLTPDVLLVTAEVLQLSVTYAYHSRLMFCSATVHVPPVDA
jgi:hypothetical protein